MTDTPKLAPATPAATPLREANQQRVDAAAQRVRQAMDYRKYLPDDPFRKDVELLIEIALAPVLEIFAAAQPAATPMAWTPQVEVYRTELMRRFSNKLSMEEIADFSYWAAQPQRESEPRQCSCPIERCDGPKSANEYCTAHPPKQFERESERMHHIWCKSLLKMDLPCDCGFPVVSGQRESEQPEQVAKLTDKILTELFKQYSGKEAKSFRHALRRTLEPIMQAALSPQTDSQEPR